MGATEAQRETLTTSVSDAELQRRWKAVRTRMEAEKIDVLVMQNRDQHLGGYVQWFTDIPARNSYPMTVIFPLKDEMTTITCKASSSLITSRTFSVPSYAFLQLFSS